MKLFLSILMLMLTITQAEAVPITANMVSLKSENTIDFKTTGSTLILSGLTNDFVPVSITLYGTNVTGTVGFPQAPAFSIGWTGPSFTDLIVNFISPISTTGNSASFSSGNVQNLAYGKAPVIPLGTNIFLNVTTADTSATTNTQQVYIDGYFLF